MAAEMLGTGSLREFRCVHAVAVDSLAGAGLALGGREVHGLSNEQRADALLGGLVSVVLDNSTQACTRLLESIGVT
ncbi:hypothetical protein OSH39_12820 [Mycobacterium ulcerans]|uniref:hypothetical protein n=1 Tax=Mycobacterium pseudoshottsii TaxID=265949 RepID=UPI0015C57E71|nr:hypothetical protein [Mycobacterium pseudoshottsii]MEB3920130.1 hypothetical protein [Mycobacterium ulcerans]MEB3925706.1 hypothetical protein [Mycobacterium ulcerans]MEB3957122.1 hypothetical protein [Mycobacterium ulcerans]MEB3969910.1 hypothetical protein [Mycobacterium ulcerans]MEB3990866.1 hypothetical protein [Mycobacterium ulcerans]